MKCVSARFGRHEQDDDVFLVRHLALEGPDEVLRTVSRYYPHDRIPPKARFLVEELFEQPDPEEEKWDGG